MWTSVDGNTWNRVPHDEAVFGGGGNPAMLSVTAGGPGLVAVGRSNSGTPVWTSNDGITWSRVPDGDSMRYGVLRSVTSGGPGLVAVGWASGATVWTSTDGIIWSPALAGPAAEDVFGGEGLQSINSIAAGDDGLVAVGATEVFNSGDKDAAVWRFGD